MKALDNVHGIVYTRGSYERSQEVTSEPKCPQCGTRMELVVIDGHDSWACPKDAYAYAVDQEWAMADEEAE